MIVMEIKFFMIILMLIFFDPFFLTGSGKQTGEVGSGGGADF